MLHLVNFSFVHMTCAVNFTFSSCKDEFSSWNGTLPSRMCFFLEMVYHHQGMFFLEWHITIKDTSLHFTLFCYVATVHCSCHSSSCMVHTCIAWLTYHFSFVKLYKFGKENFVILQLMNAWKMMFGCDWGGLLKLYSNFNESNGIGSQ